MLFRSVYEVIRNGFLRDHVPQIRSLYKARRDAMQSALKRHMPAGCEWDVPSGGMFFWLTLPKGVDAAALLPKAVELGMAFVPGFAFYAVAPKLNTLRLSFVTVDEGLIEQGIAKLAQALSDALPSTEA